MLRARAYEISLYERLNHLGKVVAAKYSLYNMVYVIRVPTKSYIVLLYRHNYQPGRLMRTQKNYGFQQASLVKCV